ncbi:MAG: hypothetical protein D6683_01475 [Actinomyces sp.]|nr:MAG: hypothetical protein D6683_01475 [Actinomyces sp.]
MSTPPRSERGAPLRRGEVTPDPGPARRALLHWQGRLGRTLAESEPHWPAPPHPGEDAPNLVLIVLDDTGFAHLGCYGSTIHTPHLDPLAGRGLRYTNFHEAPVRPEHRDHPWESPPPRPGPGAVLMAVTPPS